MKAKKTPKADLNNKRGLFFQIGLISSLILMILFFSWSQPVVSVPTISVIDVIDVIDLPPVTYDEPEKVEMSQPRVILNVELLKIVDNHRKIDNPLYVFEVGDDELTFGPYTMDGWGRAEEAEPDIIDFMVIEDQPLFQGKDVNAFRTWVARNLKYPEVAASNGVQGRVTLQFVIDRQGNLTDITVLHTPDRSLADEAIRVLKNSEQWTPGKQRGRPVAVRFTIPVDFKLQ